MTISSGVSSGKDITFCSYHGISSEDALFRDRLDSSDCVACKLFWMSQFCVRSSMSDLIKILWTSIGEWVDF